MDAGTPANSNDALAEIVRHDDPIAGHTLPDGWTYLGRDTSPNRGSIVTFGRLRIRVSDQECPGDTESGYCRFLSIGVHQDGVDREDDEPTVAEIKHVAQVLLARRFEAGYSRPFRGTVVMTQTVPRREQMPLTPVP
jgi:hypothetical protein